MLVRAAASSDAAALARVLGAIVDEGGRTAIEGHPSPAELDDWFVSGPHAVSCVVAELDGAVVGFQAVERFHALPDGWADVGTFVSADARGLGVGRALLTASLAASDRAGVTRLRAVIRAVNVEAVAFYRAMGFSDAPAEADAGLAERITLAREVGV